MKTDRALDRAPPWNHPLGLRTGIMSWWTIEVNHPKYPGSCGQKDFFQSHIWCILCISHCKFGVNEICALQGCPFVFSMHGIEWGHSLISVCALYILLFLSSWLEFPFPFEIYQWRSTLDSDLKITFVLGVFPYREIWVLQLSGPNLYCERDFSPYSRSLVNTGFWILMSQKHFWNILKYNTWCLRIVCICPPNWTHVWYPFLLFACISHDYCFVLIFMALTYIL